VALATLIAALVVLGLRRELRLRQDPLGAALLLTALVMLQVVAFNPDWVHRNESRLAALGVVPLAMAAAAAVARTGLRLSRRATIGAALGIAVASLQHRFSYGGLFVSGALYVAVEVSVAAALAVLVLHFGRRVVS
jgi:hypothetical protein